MRNRSIKNVSKHILFTQTYAQSSPVMPWSSVTNTVCQIKTHDEHDDVLCRNKPLKCHRYVQLKEKDTRRNISFKNIKLNDSVWKWQQIIAHSY